MRCSPPACPADCTGRCGCTASRWSAPSRPALRHQVEAALECRPDLAVILIGGNDVTNRTAARPGGALPGRGGPHACARPACEVVVGTCPDLGAIRPIQPPLRWLARRWSRQLAAAQTVAVVEAGGWTVSLGDLLGPRFAAEPTRMFAWDRFHPSAEGYAMAAAALLPTMLSALGATPERRGHADAPATACGRCRRPRRRRPGTPAPRSAASRSRGRDRGPAGRWAQLRRRGRSSVPARCRSTGVRLGRPRPVEGLASNERTAQRSADRRRSPARGWRVGPAARLIAARRHRRAAPPCSPARRSSPGTAATPSRSSAWRCARRSAAPARRRCGWCCSATRPRSASASTGSSETVGGQLARAARRGRRTGSAGCTCPASASPAPARPTSPPRWPGRCSASARTWR